MRITRLRLAVVFSALLVIPALSGLAVPQSDTLEADLLRGATLSASGRYLDALPPYLKAARSDDPQVRYAAQIGVVRCSLRTARFAQARTVAAGLVAAYPDDADVLALQGDAVWSAGQFDVAEKIYRDTLSIKPNSARGHLGLAKALLSRGLMSEALDHAEAAAALAPVDADVAHVRGLVFERMRRYTDAVPAYEKYVELIPGKDQGDNAVLARAKLRALRAFGRRVPYEVGGAADEVHVIPFDIVNDKVVVSGRFNGGPAIDVVIDTGAEIPVVSRATADRRGIVPISYTMSAGVGDVGFRSQQVGLIDNLYIGGFRISNLPCIIKTPPIRESPMREIESFSPLAAGMSMSLDYQRRRLTIARRLPADTRAPDFELPLWLYRLATVRGIVGNDTETMFVVDTGGQVISISTATAQALQLPSGYRRIPMKVYGLSGWDTNAFMLPGMRLAFDALRFDSTPLVVLNLEAPSALLGYELGGTVGHRLLSKYRTSIDLERSVLRLTAQPAS